MIEDWIFKDNALPFFESLASITGYDFDDDDWIAIQYGLESSNTDAVPGKWFDYQLGRTRLFVGIDSGTDVLRLRIDVDKRYVQTVQAIVDVLNRYRVLKCKC